jgi:hypothetical protein
MAFTNIWQWSETPASNNEIDGIDITGVTGKVKDGDNAIRELMSQIITTEGKGTAIASAATLTLSGPERYFHITGSTGPITDIDFTDAVDGRWAWLIFDSTPTITHNATTLQLPGGANIVAAAGDLGLIIQDATDNVICLDYIPAAAAPSTVAAVRVQVFTVNGTYTPHAKMVYCILEAVGAGGGGGLGTSSAGNSGQGGGGGGGGYALKVATASDIGASKAVTVGAGGAGQAAGSGSPGANGGDSSVGVLCIAKGGSGGNSNAGNAVATGGSGGVAGTGDMTNPGQPGGSAVGFGVNTILSVPTGIGGSSRFGYGAAAANANGGNGTDGQNYGGGGSGGNSFNGVGGNRQGGTGANGYVKITEFCSA